MDGPVGIKQDKSKENAPGLLMEIVRRLLFSSDAGQRQQEKAGLDKRFQESDQRLDGLIADHVSDLLLVSQAFSTVSSKITVSQERIRAVRESLQSCKNLLHCKRDELRRLWIEGVEMKTVYSALDAVERVNDVADRLPSLIASRNYLTATESVVTSLAVLESELSDVDALQQIKVEMSVKKEELYELLIDELHRQIYIRPTAVIFRGFQRAGSQRRDQVPLPYYSKQRNITMDENWAVDEMAVKQVMEADISKIPTSTRPLMDQTDPDSNPVTFIAVLIESLANLRRLPEAVDVLRGRIRGGLIAFVQRASQHVADGACIEDSGVSGSLQPQLLLELFQLVFRHSRVVARAHSIVLANMQRVKNSMLSLSDFALYDIAEVWSKIQGVLQLLLTDYLDVHNTAAGCQSIQSANLDDESVDIASYFLRKRPTKLKKFALFRFDASSHALSMTSYMREQRHELCESGNVGIGSGDNADGGVVYVCRRSAANITTIYNPLNAFLQDVAMETNVQPGTLSLQLFIREFVRTIYLSQVLLTIESNIAQVTKGFDTRRSLIDIHTQGELGVSKPLLKSTVVVARSIQELCSLMQDLPDYADQFVNMICKILQDYLDTCHTAYQDCVRTYSEDKKVLSSSWVKDDDINRFLRSLPNWLNLKAASSFSPSVVDDEAEDQVMSEDELRLMNSKESSILTSNLSTSESHVPSSEIISDVTLLRALGHLSESMEWFSLRIDDLTASLSTGGPACILPLPEGSSQDNTSRDLLTPTALVIPVSESTITTLSSLARHFADISELCTLVLHLEVRIHCFHHLLAIAHGQNTDYHGVIDKMEPDENVTRLNKDLAAIEDAMQQSLQSRKFSPYESRSKHPLAVRKNSLPLLDHGFDQEDEEKCLSLDSQLTTFTGSSESLLSSPSASRSGAKTGHRQKPVPTPRISVQKLFTGPASVLKIDNHDSNLNTSDYTSPTDSAASTDLLDIDQKRLAVSGGKVQYAVGPKPPPKVKIDPLEENKRSGSVKARAKAFDESSMKIMGLDVTVAKEIMSETSALEQTLLPKIRHQYIFEGLGHLVSTILINSAQFFRRINENGIKKMCRNIFSVQQCLTNITSNRESDLDHARQYYELLYLPTDDIVKAIVDRGRQFTEHEYTILLSLSHRSEYGSKDDELATRLSKFRTILTEHAMYS